MKTGSDAAYQDEINRVEDFIEFHPEALAALPPADRQVLGRYYFAGRDIDVDDVFAYRQQLVVAEPGIEERARRALERLFNSSA